MPIWRDADGHDHGPEADTQRQASPVSNRRCDRVDEAANQDDAASCQPASIPTVVRDAFRVATEERPGPVHLELPEDVARQGPRSFHRFRCIRLNARRPPRRDRSCGGDDTGGQAPSDHDRCGGKSSSAGCSALRLRAPDPASVFQHADGQRGCHRRLKLLCRHRRPFRARLCARRDRTLGPDHRDRA